MSATATASDYGVQAYENRWLGVDFSGDKRKWSLRCSNSNVWIAEIRPADGATRLVDLKRAQELRGTSDPFQRLASHLSERSFLAAAIDAPFSVPSEFLPRGGHKALLDLVANVPLKKTFPDAQAFADSVIMGRQMTVPKPLRKTEKAWQERGVNVRSTLWTGPRGGAAMTAACLYLLRKTECPIWPWAKDVPGLLAEAYPAAQLMHWKLPFQRYNDLDDLGASNRERIVSFLEDQGIQIGEFKPMLLSSADALDSVLCAFAAKGVSEGQLLGQIESSDDEGAIAVHV